MNKEIKDKWLAALRSGEYKQCRGRLKKGNKNKSFCCLGVLTDLAIKSGEVSLNWDNNLVIDLSSYINMSSLNEETIEWSGANGLGDTGGFRGKNNDYIVLAAKNDRGASFKQIANIIEKNIEGI